MVKALTPEEIMELEELERQFQWWNDDVQYEHQLMEQDRQSYQSKTGIDDDSDYFDETWGYRA